jgi:hypothetical protein
MIGAVMGEKRTPSKFSGALATPIKLPAMPLVHAVHPETEEAKQFFAGLEAKVATERLEKLALLTRHYDVIEKLGEIPALKWLLLFYRLATDCVPGFQVTGPQPGPKGGRPRTRDGVWHAALADLFRSRGLVNSDASAAALFAESELAVELGKGEVKRKPTRSEVAKRTKTIATSISSARSSAKRKATKKIN